MEGFHRGIYLAGNCWAGLALSLEFTDWIVNHANRIQIRPEGNSDESIGSGSDSTDENVAQSCSGRDYCQVDGISWAENRNYIVDKFV
ncbi:hypothetical protein BUALT_Bualt11G0012500 [Buddleja alternifolia]|uniref:Uncharacterized protein n=1 Tax=Buddleja alternifolia TaxID=168488 RepID=A0AAV6WWL9_9LAMI|nr:hypothetical protein BUALT_Bualt11G0012500 [Buddleja alternifolia]